MARGINKVILVGTLGRDPEVKYTANGGAITNLSVATSEAWNDKQTGQKQEKTEWHRVVLFGKLAEIAGQYLTKGSQVYLEGKLQTRKWQDQNTGQDRYSTEVVVDSFSGVMQMLGGGSANRGSDQWDNNAPSFASQGGQQAGGFAPQQAPQNSFNQAPAMNSNRANNIPPNNMGMNAPQNSGMNPNMNPNAGGMPPQPSPQQPAFQQPKQQSAQAPSYAVNDFDDDDVPF